MKIDLVRSFMQVEGNLKLDMTWMEKDGSVKFTGSRNYGPDDESRIRITMDKHQVEAIEECETVIGIYARYKDMGYF
ncbi:hypothetical protein [Sporosarcina sp. FSL K6-2383]|uniref:hypothetical protein n=1 Tax=Sporosarcina sp. FSL K6-2383 TaxID=2921556 RepID=UPI00315AF06D